ncbi:MULTISPECIES: hypothetical protein [unclassified Pseudomonas]|jgi:hypothetical protein|uniref:hypothetical protein n=1 Tax=unclassified Pseudomonas TaxID=196821 RepID=UPI0008E174CC|nr:MULTISPECIES: hypothetical protein [unclassified Pseudomonas]SFH80891.1 hypothetical protein SAMN03159342_00439 [Pseudomonas sp. NFPP04]SFI29682.1 hypothetical protein SAMN03159344_00438 [Pseudomonas sp. NFPP11]
MRYLRHIQWGLGLVLTLVASAAQAGSAEVRAEFRPDPSNPMVNRFTNVTPSTGFCKHFVNYCEPRGWFSLDMPIGPRPQTTGGPVAANHADPRQGVYLKVPSEWRTITVTSAAGDSSQLEVRISGIGGTERHGGHVTLITNGGDYEQLWSTGRWHKAPAPCIPTGMINGTAYWVQWLWHVPENAGACATQALFDLPYMDFPDLYFTYELRTPNPLDMPAGIYRGSQLYTVGPGMDFDFGDRVVPFDNVAILDFVLDVDHILKVEVPPGGNRVQLEPQGGWQAWLQNGRKPTRLYRDQTLNLWTSTQFKMTLECGAPMGNSCSVSNGTHQVPLDIAVTLPAGLSDASGRPVNRLPLRLDGSGSELFKPTRFVDRKPSTLHFSIQSEGVAQMLEHGSGSTYTGTATVIWDSEV